MNNYLVSTPSGNFTIKATYFSTTQDELTFTNITEMNGHKSYVAVAAFAKGRWDIVILKEPTID